jgi:hypothetical protein
MTYTRRKLKPGRPRWGFGPYELLQTLSTMAFCGVGFGVKFITQENVMWLWNQPGWCSAIGLVVAGLLKAAHQAMVDNTKKT